MLLCDRRLTSCLAFLALGLAGSMARADTADPALEKVLKDLTAFPDKDPEAAMRAIPPKFKKQMKEIFSDLLDKMDAELWDKSFEVGGKAIKLLKNKRDIIIDKLADEGHLPPGLDKKSFAELYDSALGAMAVYFSSDLSKLESAKKLDLDKFAAEINKKAGKEAMVLQKFMKEIQANSGAGASIPDPSKLFGAKVTSVKMDDDEATVKFKPVEGEAFEVVFAKYGGAWYPKEVGDAMERMLPFGKLALGQVTPDKVKAIKPQAMMVLRQLDSGIDKLDNAKTAEEFDKIAMEVFQKLATSLQPQ